MPGYILALDQGTTSSRAILFDDRQNIRGIAQKEFTQIYPAAGFVEHDAEEIYGSQMEVLGRVLRESGCLSRRNYWHRYHQPARNHHSVGSENRAADPQRDRLAVPPHRAAVRADDRRRLRRVYT